MVSPRITSPHIGCADTWKDLPEVLDVIEASCEFWKRDRMGWVRAKSMGDTSRTFQDVGILERY